MTSPTIKTPLGVLDERDGLEVTSWESRDCKTWVHIIRWDCGTPAHAILDRAGEEPRVFPLGSDWGNFTTDAEFVRFIFEQAGIPGVVVSGDS